VKRAERKEEARRTGQEFVRLPGSLKPFWRIKALTQEAAEAYTALDAAQKVNAKLLTVAWWKAVFTPKKLDLEVEKAVGAALEADKRFKKALAALKAYKSRGHGKRRAWV